MKLHMGVWLPDGEQHMTAWMTKVGHLVDGRGTYQYSKLERAVAECTERRVAIDVGAHCGLWSMHFAKLFARVIAFEPIPEHCDCFRRNVTGQYDLHQCCLGDDPGTIGLHYDPTNTGDTHAVVGDGYRLEAFDLIYPTLQHVDLVKLDCEGFELFALRGMALMLRRCQPVVLVEQKPNRASKYGLRETEAVDWLQGLGAHRVWDKSGDYLLRW